MMYGLYNDYNWWGVGNMMGFVGGWIMMVVFWVLVITLIVWIVRRASGKDICSHHSSHTNSNSRALDILKERYAKGEIDKKEFEEKRKDIS